MTRAAPASAAPPSWVARRVYFSPTDSMTCVSTIMTSRVTTVGADLPLYDLICLLVDKNVGGLPVIDAAGRAIGMVSQSDLIWEDHDWAESRTTRSAWRKIAGRQVAEDAELLDERNLGSRTVADVMTSGALFVLPTASIEVASRLMVSNRVHRLPVVDEQELLVGIVTTWDITRWVAQHSPDGPA